MNTFGKHIRVSLFGESHGPVIGITIDGLPAGLCLPIEIINDDLRKRKGAIDISTPRREPDQFEIISGYFEDHTTGAPLTIIIKNQDIDNEPYKEHGLIRPGHADLAAYLKYNGFHDYLGGGHSSGRITAPLVILGSICKSLLQQRHIQVFSRIASVKDIQDIRLTFEETTPLQLLPLENSDFPVLDPRAKALMLAAIKKAKKMEDALGGTIETFVFGVPAGMGEPFFDSFESILSHVMFSIPGIKAIAFGDGFEMSKKYASEIVDQLEMEKGKLLFRSNHQGGINGGITNGNIVQFTLGVRAPSSIAKPLSSINIRTGENVMVSTIGRHDPIIVHRILPVVQALTHWVILDYLLESEIYHA